MHSAYLLRRASTRALLIALASLEFSYGALAQQALPTINIGGATRRSTSVAAPRTRTADPATPIAAAPVVSSERFEPRTPTEAYVVRNADSTTKSNIPIKELPQSIQVIPRQVLTDQQVTNLKDAASNASGVLSNNLEGVGAQFYLRGFKQNFIFRNALALTQSDNTPLIVDTANVERVEVLKGPSSMLYGRSDAGGLINIVTKQPLDQPLYRLEQQIGSYDHYRTEWDVSAPVAEVPGLAYRVSGAYQNNGSFRQFQGGRRGFLAPVVRYSPTPWTEFTAEAELLTSRIQNDLGQPTGSLFAPLVAPLPNTRSFQEPNDPKDVLDKYVVSYNFRQNLNENWKVTNRFLYSDSRWSSTQASTAGLGSEPFSAAFNSQSIYQLNRFTQFQDFKSYNLSTNIDLSGKFEALGAKHDFLFGLDYANFGYDYVYNNGLDNYPINIYDTVYGTIPGSAYHDSVIGSGFKFLSSFVARQKGMYVQDHITWFDKFHLLIGGRRDIADVTRGTPHDNDGNKVFDYRASKGDAIYDRAVRRQTSVFPGWSPRIGVVYDILPELSAYASYSRSFGKLAAFDSNGVAFPPERGLQWEFGLKAQPLPGLMATLAFFQITKSGVTTTNFNAFGASQLAGLQRSRGVEFDLIGAINDRMTVIANYAYIDAKVIADAAPNPLNPFGSVDEAVYGPQGGLLGNHLEFAPRHSGKLFMTYDFGDNGYGFRVGGGITASTHWWGNIQNTFTMPGYARLDGFASYTADVYGHKVTAKLNLQNLNNVRYFDAVDDSFNQNAPPNFRIPARPFTAVGSIAMKW